MSFREFLNENKKMSIKEFEKYLLKGGQIMVDNGGVDSDILMYNKSEKSFSIGFDNKDISKLYKMYSSADDSKIMLI